jgi:hypothetical protein
MSGKSVVSEEKNPRGIPKAPFIVRLHLPSQNRLLKAAIDRQMWNNTSGGQTLK